MSREIEQRIEGNGKELADIAIDLVAPLPSGDGNVLIVIDQGGEASSDLATQAERSLKSSPRPRRKRPGCGY